MINLKIEEPSYTKNETIQMGRILIIDDEVDICIMLAKYLQTLNFETDYVSTVKQTIQSINTHSYDILFVDLNLMDGSGYDVIEYAKKLNLPAKIIVISAHDSESSRVIEKGADIFVAKPFTTRTIHEALRRFQILPS